MMALRTEVHGPRTAVHAEGATQRSETDRWLLWRTGLRVTRGLATLGAVVGLYFR